MKNYPYEVKEIGNGIFLINEKLSTMYVIEGTQRAVVIDCGTGVGDFRKIVDNITKLPYDLLITHAHVDHIGGRGQFGDMYISAVDAKKIKSVTPSYRRFYTGINVLSGVCKNLNDVEIKKNISEPKVHIIREGDSFDLGGGRVIEVFETPGHTNGSMSFLLKSEKMIFTGDVANEVLLMWLSNASTISTLQRTLDKLYGIEGYDIFWPSHATEPSRKEEILKIRELAYSLNQKHNFPLPMVVSKKRGKYTIMYRATHIH